MADLFVEFIPKRPNEACLTEADQATAQANQAAADRGWGEIVDGEPPSRSPRGALVRLKRPSDTTAIQYWLETYAGALSAMGQQGRLITPRRTKYPEWGRTSERQPAAFLFFPTDPSTYTDDFDDASPGRWSVAADLTKLTIEAAARWVPLNDGYVTMIKLGAFRFPTSTEAIPSLLRAGLDTETSAGAQALVEKTQRLKGAGFFPPNGLMLQSMDEERSNSDLLAERIAAATTLAPHLSVAFFAQAAAVSITGTLAMESLQPRPLQSRSFWVWHSLLHASRVWDAFGVQILTGQHLEHAHDLSDWIVTEVAPDRYLVQTHDLAAWYADIAPPPELHQKARADFGEMILTP